MDRPAAARALVVRADDGELIETAGVQHLFKLAAGALGLERFSLPPGVVGARAHVHFSLWDADGSTNLLSDPADPFAVSTQGRFGCLYGVQDLDEGNRR